jgi:hypothetical protein
MHLRYSYTPMFYQNILAMWNTADVTVGVHRHLIAVSGVSAVSPLVALTTTMEERER